MGFLNYQTLNFQGKEHLKSSIPLLIGIWRIPPPTRFFRELGKEALLQVSSFLTLRRHPGPQQANRYLLQFHPQCSCHPVPPRHNDPSLALARSPGIENSYLLAAWAPRLYRYVGEGVESPVLEREGTAQDYTILKKVILFSVLLQPLSVQTSHSLLTAYITSFVLLLTPPRRGFCHHIFHTWGQVGPWTMSRSYPRMIKT